MKKSVVYLLVCLLTLQCFGTCLADGHDAVFAELKAEYPSGSLWTQAKYGGIECYSFAREVLNRLFGSYPENISSVNHCGISGGFVALKPDPEQPDRAKAIINALKPGDYVRFYPAPGAIHSGVVLSADEDNVFFVDANNVAKDTVSWESVFPKSLLADNLQGVFIRPGNDPIPFAVLGAIGMITITYDRRVNIRADSNGRADLVGLAIPSDRFICLGKEKNGWYRIIYSPGIIGYVSHKLATLDTSVQEYPIVIGE